jgi:hypothetical protein
MRHSTRLCLMESSRDDAKTSGRDAGGATRLPGLTASFQRESYCQSEGYLARRWVGGNGSTEWSQSVVAATGVFDPVDLTHAGNHR